MEAFIFNADLLCGDCGRDVRRQQNELALMAWRDGEAHADDADQSNPDLITALGFDPADEESYDSGDYPKGPYPNGGGEADTPQHCGKCGRFLQNPLTEDGKVYVRDECETQLYEHGRFTSEAAAEWYTFYAYLWASPVVLENGDELELTPDEIRALTAADLVYESEPGTGLHHVNPETMLEIAGNLGKRDFELEAEEIETGLRERLEVPKAIGENDSPRQAEMRAKLRAVIDNARERSL